MIISLQKVSLSQSIKKYAGLFTFGMYHYSNVYIPSCSHQYREEYTLNLGNKINIT